MQDRRSLPVLVGANRNLTFLGAAVASLGVIALVLLRFQTHGGLLQMMVVSALALGILVVVHPTIGVYATLFAAVFVRMTVSTGTDTPIVASIGCAAALCAGWAIHQVLNRRRLIMLPRAVAIPAMGLMAFMVFALFWGRVTLDPRISYYSAFFRVQLAALALVIISVALLFVGADIFQRREVRYVVAGTIVIVGLLYLPFRVVNHSIPVLEVGGLFGMWFTAIAWSQALINQRLPMALRVILGIATGAYFVNQFFFLSSWVSGWLPIGIALVTITTIARPRLGVICIVLIVASCFIFSSHMNAIVQSEESEGSASGQFGRAELWQRNIHILGDTVVMGTGPVTYALYYVTFDPDQAMSTHNNYLDILDEAGIGGILSMFGLLGALFFIGHRTVPKLEDPADRAIAIGILGGVLGATGAMFFGDWVIPFVYNQTIAGFDHSVYTWFMFAVLCGLAVQVRKTELSGG
jgi:hypothetical protein